MAVWQHRGEHTLIDQDGVALANTPMVDAESLLVLVGADVPAHAAEFMLMVTQEEPLRGQVEAAVRVGKRRWNVHLRGGTKVLLPEDAPGDAWAELARLQREQSILDRSLNVIDMRVQDTVFLQSDEELAPPASEQRGKDISA